MNQKSFTYLGLGLCIPIILLLKTIDDAIGLPSFTHKGMSWEEVEQNDWTAHKVELTYKGDVNIERITIVYPFKQMLTSELPVDHRHAKWTGALKKWIKTVKINALDLEWNEAMYPTDLRGQVYPLIQLQNDWMSIEKTTETSHWNVSGQLDSTDIPFNLTKPDLFPQSLEVNLQYTLSIASLDKPIEGTILDVKFEHPLLGRSIRIPTMDLTVQQSMDTWTVGLSNEKSTVDWIWINHDQKTDRPTDIGKSLQWAMNYNISLSDLTDWFQVNIPISSPMGHWAGTLTPTEATISGSNLGFEGKIYALNRLQAGQPITYQPIHAEYTQLIGPNTPSWIPYPQLGWLAKAVIAGEDAPFYTHDGFNEEGLNRALNQLLKDKENPIGGSSITQQVAKNLFTGNQTTLDRKIEEMVYTLGLEATLNKEAILALYLNSIEFGDGIYGVREASEKYFLKEPRYLSLKEAVFLASILPNPRDGYRRAKRGYPPTRRMKAILQNLVDGNQISTVIMKETMKEPLRLLLPVD